MPVQVTTRTREWVGDEVLPWQRRLRGGGKRSKCLCHCRVYRALKRRIGRFVDYESGNCSADCGLSKPHLVHFPLLVAHIVGCHEYFNEDEENYHREQITSYIIHKSDVF